VRFRQVGSTTRYYGDECTFGINDIDTWFQ